MALLKLSPPALHAFHQHASLIGSPHCPRSTRHKLPICDSCHMPGECSLPQGVGGSASPHLYLVGVDRTSCIPIWAGDPRESTSDPLPATALLAPRFLLARYSVSTCMRSEPVNDGPWAYRRVGGRYLRRRAVETLEESWTPRGTHVSYRFYRKSHFLPLVPLQAPRWARHQLSAHAPHHGTGSTDPCRIQD